MSGDQIFVDVPNEYFYKLVMIAARPKPTQIITKKVQRMIFLKYCTYATTRN
jgi:hypothetical protein